MGGRGSGRKWKPKKELIEELLEEILTLRQDVTALHKKVNRVTARWSYWLKNQ